MPLPRSVLFVCTANQCRSAAAEHFLRRRLRQAGLSLQVGSAGVAAWPGSPALIDTARAAGELDVDLRDHESRQVTPQLLQQYELILAMTRRHVLELYDLYPPAASRIFLFRAYCLGQGNGEDLDDPVGLPLEAHLACLRTIDSLVGSLVARWQA